MVNKEENARKGLLYMHVLFVSDADSKYGASSSMKQMIKGILECCDDIEISVVLPLRIDTNKELENYYRELGCNVYKIFYEPFYQNVPEQKWRFPIKYFLRGMEYLFGRWTGVFYLSKKMNINDVDIIHSNSSREDFGAMLALKYNKPLIWHIREFGDKDYKCFSYRRGYIGFMNEAAKKFITVSNAVRDHWIKKGVDERKIVRIYDGVCAELNFKKEYRKNADGKLRFLILGSVCETKGQYQIINACALMSEKERERITVDIIGSGNQSYIRRMKEMIKKNKLTSSIHFLGYHEEAWKNICSYTCGLMCSKSEGFGRVTAEYMMAGLPVIASDTGANPELIVDNESGLLFQWNNIEDLKNKMVYLLNHANVPKQMGLKAREYAQSHFSLKINAELIYREYIKIVQRQ